VVGKIQPTRALAGGGVSEGDLDEDVVGGHCVAVDGVREGVPGAEEEREHVVLPVDALQRQHTPGGSIVPV